ncbi:uncharacterized protein [Nicotiana tomentosiformis]|uniref:uncharacterized protein n=1 Tax=Nicotiana tomentosiformis TaxID=4098 RepID=UPI00388CB6CC
MVIPGPDEGITTHVEGYLSVYTYPLTLGPLDPGHYRLMQKIRGLSKDVTLRPSSGGENIPAESPAPRQGDEKKRKKSLGSLRSEKKKLRRRLVRKSKESTSAQVPSSDSIYQLRDESEKEGEAFDLMAHVSLQPEGQGASEPKRDEADLPQVREADKEAVAKASRDVGNSPKEAHDVIDITESPSFTESMYNEAQTVKERPIEGAHGADDSFTAFLMAWILPPRRTSTGWASVLHHKTFLRYRDDMNQLKAEVQGIIEKRDTYKFLSEQHEGEAKSLRTELEVARKEYADLVEQMHDRPSGLGKGAARAQLTSAKTHLRAAKEKVEVHAKKVDDLQSQLSATVSDQENLAKELETSKSVVLVVKDDANKMVVQYKADAEVAQDQTKDIVEYAKRQSRREALGEIHARGFDLSAEIESAKGLEADAKKLAYHENEEGSDGLSGSEGGGDSEDLGDEAGSGEDQAV